MREAGEGEVEGEGRRKERGGVAEEEQGGYERTRRSDHPSKRSGSLAVIMSEVRTLFMYGNIADLFPEYSATMPILFIVDSTMSFMSFMLTEAVNQPGLNL